MMLRTSIKTRVSVILSILGTALLPALAAAQVNVKPNLGGSNLVEPSVGSLSNQVVGLIQAVVNVLLVFVGVLAVAAIVWGGIMYITSLGNDQRTASAKKIIFWAIVGLIVVLMSLLIIQFIGGAFKVPV